MTESPPAHFTIPSPREQTSGKSRLKVLHVYAGNLFGGLENSLVSIAALRSLSPRIDVFFALCFKGLLQERLEATGVPVHLLNEVRYRRPWTVWKARRKLRRVLAETRPDVVITHECWPHLLAAPEVRRHGSALVYWMHGWATGTWMERMAGRHPPDRVIATSLYSTSMLPKLFPGAACDVIHPVIIPPVLDREAARHQVREEFKADPGEVVIAITCRIVPYKGHDLLFAALGLLRDQPGWKLWVAGAPQKPEEQVYLDRLRVSAGKLGITNRILFLGHRSDVSRILAGADIHCQPNRGPEPFGIAFVEALYAGLPVVTTGFGGALEIIDETCGRLVPPDDPPALAAVLQELISDEAERRRLGAGGPTRARERFDPSIPLGQLENMLVTLRMKSDMSPSHFLPIGKDPA